MYSWGQSSHGQLGLGGIEESNVSLPTEIPFRGGEGISRVSAGIEHSMVQAREGKVYSCGSNDFGQLGREGTQSKYDEILSLKNYDIMSVVCGGYHTLALDEWGKVFSWGSNSRGQLGTESGNRDLPKIIKTLGAQSVVQIAAGLYHSLALTDKGDIFAWGDNTYGQLGLGRDVGEFISTPKHVNTLVGVAPLTITAGAEHSIIVTVSGAVYSWGKNSFGQLGHGDFENHFFPKQIRTLRRLRVKYVACGNDHSVVLTEDGGVFSFGCSRFGQLGHGTYNNEVVPKKIMELMGDDVSQIACGSRHTLAFLPSAGKLYSFGLGGTGQLGRQVLTNTNTPQIVCGPWAWQAICENNSFEKDQSKKRNNSVFIYSIGAGGNSSFAVVRPKSNSEAALDFRVIDESVRIKTLTFELMEKIASLIEDEALDLNLMETFETIFQSPSCLNGSFLVENEHYNCSSKNHGVDLDAWRDIVFQRISTCANKSLTSLIYESITKALLPKLVNEPPDAEAVRIFLILPLYKEFENAEQNFRELHLPFALRYLLFDGNGRRILEKWIADSDRAYFKNLVTNFKAAVVECFKSDESENRGIGKLSEHSMTLMLVLYFFHKINVEQNCKIEDEEFYISTISEYFDLQRSYIHWLLNNEGESLLQNHICNFPFIFDASAKTTLLQVDQGFQMHSAQQRATFQFWFAPEFVDLETIPFLNFVVDRSNLVQDTLVTIQRLTSAELKKPIRVKFTGEEAEDAGGVKKEFFLLLIREITDPKYGMFKIYDSGAMWFSSSYFEDPSVYFLIGVICGLAIYNFTIINLAFPLPLYKKLLGVKVGTIKDFEMLSPTTALNFEGMLEYRTDQEIEELYLNFTITEEVLGRTKVVELKPGGEFIDVTLENRKEYVDLYIDYILNKSVEIQYDAFHKGFHKVCGGHILDLFHARELMALIVGNENYDWEILENNTIYKEGYTKDSKTIKFFWSVFHELSLEEKKKFLLFLTGTDRIPILGMSAIPLIIQKVNDINYLPVAHTCFNILDLPAYRSRDTLKEKLLIAIECTQGFGLA